MANKQQAENNGTEEEALNAETASETADETENDSETDSDETAPLQQEEGNGSQAANQPGASDVEALAQRLLKTEREIEQMKKGNSPTRAKVKIETKTVPPVRKDAKPAEPVQQTRAQMRHRTLKW